MIPSQASLALLPVVPLALILFKCAYPKVDFKFLWVAAAVCSWLIVNIELRIDPPNNGLAYPIHFVLGWVWILPFFAAVRGIYWVVSRLAPAFIQSLGFRRLAMGLLIFVASGTLWLAGYAFFGRISRDKACLIAADYMQYERRISHFGTSSAEWRNGGWIVTFSVKPQTPVYVNRSGIIKGFGG
jgi:hypothetical protein